MRNYSLIIPVYKNEKSIPDLIDALSNLNNSLENQLEVVFVNDGSPDLSYKILKDNLETFTFRTQLIVHSRNFGSFAAIRTGLTYASGKYFAVLAADLQEPPELILQFFNSLKLNECDVAIGTRVNRKDPIVSKLMSNCFWTLYRRLVMPEMPKGGVDVFGCNQIFRDQLLKLEESKSSLIALVFWLGFRRKYFEYERSQRIHGKSAWSFSKKMDYMFDSIFSFTDLPIRLLTRIGAAGTFLSLLLGTTIIIIRLFGAIQVPGYAATIVAVLFLNAINLFGIGLIGTYAWRAYENSKNRPIAVVSKIEDNIESNSL